MSTFHFKKHANAFVSDKAKHKLQVALCFLFILRVPNMVIIIFCNQIFSIFSDTSISGPNLYLDMDGSNEKNGLWVS